MDKVITSPLRYMGGKRWLFHTLADYIPKRTTEMVSPFFGGGALELNLAARGIQVHGFDLCPNLVNFWSEWLVDPLSVLAEAKSLVKEHDTDWFKVKIKLSDVDAPLYYALNRLVFNGSITGGVRRYEMNVNDEAIILSDRKRVFSTETFPLWENLPKLPITVDAGDFQESLLTHKDKFAYVDPPYVGKEVYYQACPSKFPHERLAETLKKRRNWVLSYGDNELIRSLYRDFKSIYVYRNTHYAEFELLIFSDDIAEQHFNDGT